MLGMFVSLLGILFYFSNLVTSFPEKPKDLLVCNNSVGREMKIPQDKLIIKYFLILYLLSIIIFFILGSLSFF